MSDLFGSEITGLLKKIFFISLLFASLFISFSRSVAGLREGNDFCQDYISASRLLARRPIYSPLQCWKILQPTGIQVNAHPPFSVILFVPFTLLPLLPATYLWIFLSLAAYLASVALLLKLFKRLSLPYLALFTLGSLIWPVYVMAVSVNNVPQVLLLLILLSYFLYFRHKYYLCGLVLGFAGLIKLWPLLLLAGFLITGHKKIFISGFLFFIYFLLITFPLIGLSDYAAYFRFVYPRELFFLADPLNISLSGVITRMFSGFPLNHIYSLVRPAWPLSDSARFAEIIDIIILIFSFFILRRYRGQKSAFAVFGFLLSVIFFIFPLSWYWSLFGLFLPLAFILKTMKNNLKPSVFNYLLLTGFLIPFITGKFTVLLFLLPVLTYTFLLKPVDKPPGDT